MLLIAFLAFIVLSQQTSAFNDVLDPCGYCDKSQCSSAEGCPMGIVQDRCGCCDVCGLEQGHRCNTRRELTDIALSKRTFGSYGQCGENLECQERSDVSHEVMGTENVCVCVKPGRFCASNGETYSACQMDAVSITSKGKITIVSYDDCKSGEHLLMNLLQFQYSFSLSEYKDVKSMCCLHL